MSIMSSREPRNFTQVIVDVRDISACNSQILRTVLPPLGATCTCTNVKHVHGLHVCNCGVLALASRVKKRLSLSSYIREIINVAGASNQ